MIHYVFISLSQSLHLVIKRQIIILYIFFRFCSLALSLDRCSSPITGMAFDRCFLSCLFNDSYGLQSPHLARGRRCSHPCVQGAGDPVVWAGNRGCRGTDWPLAD